MSDRLVLTLNTPQTQRLVLNAPQSEQTLTITNPLTGSSSRVRIVYDTTANWNSRISYIPPKETIVVYTDRNVIDTVSYVGIKFGDGNAYLIDLPFVGDDIAMLITQQINEHVGNTDIHVTPEEKTFWNNKLNFAIDGERLILNRN